MKRWKQKKDYSATK